jgi:predicted phage terminase large subunit-like protein
VALDPSKGVESKHGDYSAFVMIAVFQGTIYVDADLEIRNTSIIAETAIELQRTFQADAFGIETNQFQQLLADDITRRAGERNLLMPIWTYENYVKKVVRIRRLTPYLAKGRIRFKAGSKGARLLVEQLRDFPNGDHDDGPDALDQALQLAGEVWGRTREDFYEVIYVA